MSFNGTEGKVISLADGAEITQNWRNEHANESKAVFFGKDHIEDLLRQTGCVGIRIYYAINESNDYTMVLVGTNEDEDDMTELVIDTGMRCPPRCAQPNSLNGNE